MAPSNTPATARRCSRGERSGRTRPGGSGKAKTEPTRLEEPQPSGRVATVTAVALRDGRRVSVERWPGEGAPLVLLHGLLDCAVGWKHLAAAIRRPCFAVDLPGFGDSDRPTRNRISAYTEDVQAALAALDVHDFTLVGHSLGGAVATGLAERLRDDVAALVLIAPVGFGRIHLAEAIQLPGVRTLVRHALPLALTNPVSASGVYMAVVGNGHLPDPELAERLRKNAFRWTRGAACANEAVTASGLSPGAFFRRRLEYTGPVLALWGDRDRLVPLAHRDGVMTAFPQAQVSVWRKMGHHPQRERPAELAQFVEAACSRARPSERATREQSRRTRVRAVRSAPPPLAAGTADLSAVA
jgi:pimeloyl-ACP methyl ester carboxylesterase